MSDFLKGKYIRLRCKKSYSGAHTHIMIGRALEETDRYVVVKGRTFHFRRIIDGALDQVQAGEVTIRIVPWENVEVVHWIDDSVDYYADFTFDAAGNLVLSDDDCTIIAERREGLE